MPNDTPLAPRGSIALVQTRHDHNGVTLAIQQAPWLRGMVALTALATALPILAAVAVMGWTFISSPIVTCGIVPPFFVAVLLAVTLWRRQALPRWSAVLIAPFIALFGVFNLWVASILTGGVFIPISAAVGLIQLLAAAWVLYSAFLAPRDRQIRVSTTKVSITKHGSERSIPLEDILEVQTTDRGLQLVLEEEQVPLADGLALSHRLWLKETLEEAMAVRRRTMADAKPVPDALRQLVRGVQSE